MNELKLAIYEALQNALDNGNDEIIGWTTPQLIEDLMQYGGFEDNTVEEMTPIVDEWLAEQ